MRKRLGNGDKKKSLFSTIYDRGREAESVERFTYLDTILLSNYAGDYGKTKKMSHVQDVL